jgi:hypothetical protein
VDSTLSISPTPAASPPPLPQGKGN